MWRSQQYVHASGRATEHRLLRQAGRVASSWGSARSSDSGACFQNRIGSARPSTATQVDRKCAPAPSPSHAHVASSRRSR